MNTEKVLKIGAISLILYYLRNYIARGMIGCEYIWDNQGLRFLSSKCLWIFVLVCIVSIAMWLLIIRCIILIFRKDKTYKEVKENGKRKYR